MLVIEVQGVLFAWFTPKRNGASHMNIFQDLRRGEVKLRFLWICFLLGSILHVLVGGFKDFLF